MRVRLQTILGRRYAYEFEELDCLDFLDSIRGRARPTIEMLNDIWRRRVTELSDDEKNADAEFIKAWLRGNYAETQRERKKSATPGDFDVIGTAFHKWVRDNTKLLGLSTKEDYRWLVEHEFMGLSARYLQLLEATQNLTSGLEPVFHNATTGFTLQLPVILVALTPDDDDETFEVKCFVVAGALDIFVARRMVNYRNFGYSTVQYSMFNLMKRIRNQPLESVKQQLGEWLAGEPERLESLLRFRLNYRNRSHNRYLLARMTSWLDEQIGRPGTFAEYVDRHRRHPYEVEHIWANHYERYLDEFPSEHEFQEHRNLMGGLVLLPKDFNASFGDLPYSEKLPQYNAQNILVRSLHPLAYENNPSFLRVKSEANLPFKPYPEAYGPIAIEERQELYWQLCERIWDPAAIGLPESSPDALVVESAEDTFGEGVRSLLASLVNADPIRTLEQGKPNWISALDAENVWVETQKTREQETGAQPVPIEWLEDARRILLDHGELTVDLLGDSSSHRSALLTEGALLLRFEHLLVRTEP